MEDLWVPKTTRGRRYPHACMEQTTTIASDWRPETTRSNARNPTPASLKGNLRDTTQRATSAGSIYAFLSMYGIFKARAGTPSQYDCVCLLYMCLVEFCALEFPAKSETRELREIIVECTLYISTSKVPKYSMN